MKHPTGLRQRFPSGITRKDGGRRTDGRTDELSDRHLTLTREGPDRASFCLGQTEAPTRFARTDRQTVPRGTSDILYWGKYPVIRSSWNSNLNTLKSPSNDVNCSRK